MTPDDPKSWEFETICQHTGEDYSHLGAVVPPLFQNSLFTYKSAAEFCSRIENWETWDYTRVNNPTLEVAQKKIASLEEAGACRLFGSGMAAISATVMNAVHASEHVVCTSAAYGPTKALLRDYLPQYGITTTFVDGTDLQEIEQAIQPNTKLIFMESPGTFLFAIQDIEAICRLARSRNILTAIDNSCATPYFQKPCRFGVDYVVHTVTKYLGGHSDIVAGAVCGSSERIRDLVWKEGLLLGAVCDPFAGWLLTRSLRTLAIRMERHQASGIEIASMLEKHPKVERVYYPGLETHPGQNLIKKQMSGVSGLMTMTPKFQTDSAVFAFCENLRLFQIGCSWGGHESLAIPVKSDADPTTWHVRLSIGLESANDLAADLSDRLAEA